MMRTMARAKLESGIARLGRLPRRPMIAGALSGVLSGLTLGAFTGPVGAVLGMWIGFGVGFVTGYVLAHDDEKRSVRTQELDAIIGITAGSMGVGRSIAPPAAEADDDDPEPYSSREAWLAEWLTPPPPACR